MKFNQNIGFCLLPYVICFLVCQASDYITYPSLDTMQSTIFNQSIFTGLSGVLYLTFLIVIIVDWITEHSPTVFLFSPLPLLLMIINEFLVDSDVVFETLSYMIHVIIYTDLFIPIAFVLFFVKSQSVKRLNVIQSFGWLCITLFIVKLTFHQAAPYIFTNYKTVLLNFSSFHPKLFNFIQSTSMPSCSAASITLMYLHSNSKTFKYFLVAYFVIDSTCLLQFRHCFIFDLYFGVIIGLLMYGWHIDGYRSSEPKVEEECLPLYTLHDISKIN
ncbi:hypothetical protein BC833DRAFT_250445 [Globomyces pollinis-pini]|nr:hypothetical protein BC833DRAFT_250445 [Globomyces pollinis-pini]